MHTDESGLSLSSAFCTLRSALPAAASAQAPADGPAVVIPFDNPTQDPRLAWLREGAAILLTDALAAIGVAVVEREERLQAFDRLQLPAHAALSRASTIRVGHALSARVGDYRHRADAGRSAGDSHAHRSPRYRPAAPGSGSQRRAAGHVRRVCHARAAHPRRSGDRDRERSPARRRRRCSSCMSKVSSRKRPPTQVAFLEQALQAAPKFDRVRLALWDAAFGGVGAPARAGRDLRSERRRASCIAKAVSGARCR